tara:strand:- start:11 stop:1090 length:1080 start_codon:yes stop_codon:yes gene_type:complete
MNFNKNIIVGMSGGVDSSISAIILKEMGYNVRGLFMKNWEEDDDNGDCNVKSDYEDAKRITNKLGIDLLSVNFSDKYWDLVFQKFIDDLNQGLTPNPDILCNKEIKFKYFLNYALTLECDKLATGHYAKIKNTGNIFSLNKPKDRFKDQTYFLYTLNQTILNNILFPLNEITKAEVKEIAKSFDLKIYEKKESMGICFIGKKNYSKLISKYIRSNTGNFIDENGKKLGQHKGLFLYTIGQRKGIGIGGLKSSKDKPWYVIDKLTKSNEIIISQDETKLLYNGRVKLRDVNWINHEPSLNKSYKARFRHGGKLINISMINEGAAWLINLKESERALTYGQSAVIYDNDECIGGGIIEKLC